MVLRLPERIYEQQLISACPYDFGTLNGAGGDVDMRTFSWAGNAHVFLVVHALLIELVCDGL